MVLLEELVGRLDQPARPIIRNVALRRIELSQKLAHITSVVDTLLVLSDTHDVVEMIRLALELQIVLHLVKVELELLDRVIFSDSFYHTLEG